METPFLVSACLLGLPCRYDGGSCPVPALQRLAALGQAIPICPEVVGGLPTPRPPAEIQGGDGGDVLDGQARVVREDGTDVSGEFVAGARAALHLARRCGVTRAVLKANSPSCGVGLIDPSAGSPAAKRNVITIKPRPSSHFASGMWSGSTMLPRPRL